MGPVRSVLRKIGIGPSLCFTFIQIQMFSLIDCPILSLHLSLYVISYYIRKLHVRIKSNRKMSIDKLVDTLQRYVLCCNDIIEFHWSISSDSLYLSQHEIQYLEESIGIFARICQCNAGINSTFSSYVCLALMIKFVALIGNFFAIIFGIFSSDAALNNSIIYMAYMVVIEWSRIMAILLSADMPTREVKKIAFFLVDYCETNNQIYLLDTSTPWRCFFSD